MNILILLICTVGISIGKPAGLYSNPSSVYYSNSISPLHTHSKSQFHTQDELGQYSYGYADGLSAKTESKSLDGITHGSYSYLDSNGIVQNVNYIADDVNGFRVAASNLPVGPAAVPVNSAAIPVRSSGPAAILSAAHGPSAKPDPIFAPVQQLPQFQHHGPVLGDPAPQYPQGVYPLHPGYLSSPGSFNEVLPQFDPHISSGDDSVSVTAAKIFRDHIPRPVQDTPEVTAAKVKHMAAVQQAIAASQHVTNRNDDYDSYNDDTEVVQSDPAHHPSYDAYPLSSAPVATPPRYPFSPHHGNLGSNVITQYHRQDELGQYSYGYAGGPSAKTESRSLDGVTRGTYSYVDARGTLQRVQYVSDPTHGFRVAASNLPVVPTALGQK